MKTLVTILFVLVEILTAFLYKEKVIGMEDAIPGSIGFFAVWLILLMPIEQNDK